MAFWQGKHRRIGLLGGGVLVAVLTALAVYLGPRYAPQSIAPTPADIAALRSLEARVQATISKVASAVVAVKEVEEDAPQVDAARRLYQGYASGVIISAEGLVLSQFHVSHRHEFHGNRAEQERSRQPHERTTVILSDGRAVAAELLGADQVNDFSLLRLLDAGPYPYVPLEPKAEVGLGDWVLKFGHPIGYRADRSFVVRLGRVVSKEGSLFVTDCLITGGDSGGPFFDLDGRLMGMVGDSQVPPMFKDLRIPLPAQLFNCDTSSFIQTRVPDMLRSQMSTAGRNLDAERVQALLKSQNILPGAYWTQGTATASAFRDMVEPAGEHVVEIRGAGDRQAACGTIVAADGWILTVASLLPAEPKCRLPDRQVVSAKIIAINRPFDLALLKVPISNLRPIDWARDQPGARVGALLAAPGAVATQDKPLLGVGMVSVPTREFSGPFPDQRAHPLVKAEAPGLSGMPTAGGLRLDTFDAASNPGLRQNDILIAMDEKLIRNQEDVQSIAEGRDPGDRVVVRILRKGQPLEFSTELKAKPLTWTKPYGNLPTFFEHDMPLAPNQCGGPVIDLNGKAAGLTVFRGKYGCLAIPADRIQRLLPQMQSGPFTRN